MNTVKYRALAKDGTWRYGLYPCLDVDMGNLKYPMDVFWNSFLASFRRETLGQWTGLLDKYGKEIYQGDILQYHDYMWNFKVEQIHIGVVRWQDWNGAFDCERRIIDGKEVKPEHGLPGIQFKWQAEVIGNIYENPHLLKEIVLDQS